MNQAYLSSDEMKDVLNNVTKNYHPKPEIVVKMNCIEI